AADRQGSETEMESADHRRRDARHGRAAFQAGRERPRLRLSGFRGRENRAEIAFIGLGNMGGPMAANLVKAQHQVFAFDLSAAAVDAAVEKGAHKAPSAAEAVKGAEIVVTMLPAGKHVRAVYENDVLPNAAKGALVIDCRTRE